MLRVVIWHLFFGDLIQNEKKSEIKTPLTEQGRTSLWSTTYFCSQSESISMWIFPFLQYNYVQVDCFQTMLINSILKWKSTNLQVSNLHRMKKYIFSSFEFLCQLLRPSECPTFMIKYSNQKSVEIFGSSSDSVKYWPKFRRLHCVRYGKLLKGLSLFLGSDPHNFLAAHSSGYPNNVQSCFLVVEVS